MSQIDSATRSPRNYTTRTFLRDLWRFIRPYKGRFIVATLARVAGDIVWLYPAYALAETVTLLTTWEPGDSTRPFQILFVGMLVAITIRRAGAYIARMCGNHVAERATLDAKIQGMEYLSQLDLAWHEQENAGNKVKRIDSGAESINVLLRIWINNLLEIGVSLVGVLFILTRFDTFVAGMTAIFALLYYFFSTLLLRRASRATKLVNKQKEELQGAIFEGINNIRTVKVLAMTSSVMRSLERVANEVFVRVKTRIWWFQIRGLITGWGSEVFRLGMIAWIVYGIMQGWYEVGFLLIFYSYFSRILEAITELAEVVVEGFVISKNDMARMMEIYDTPVYRDGKDAKKIFPKTWNTISLRQVGFSYGGDQVLKNISFDIRRGERVGIVGLSGAGKSTLFKLLLKENEDYSGEILIDDVPLRKIKKSAYYERATVVLQDTEVFNLSLRENITLANPAEKNNEKALKQALDVAHVSSFLTHLPNGLNTEIGEKGIKLSGGERQRVGIARAVFKRPEILFLDEATSHLDLESEDKIRDSLHVFFRQVTAVVIAHRLTTIKEMDRIIVLEGGELIEQGSFEELYKQRGRFYHLWELQKLD